MRNAIIITLGVILAMLVLCCVGTTILPMLASIGDEPTICECPGCEPVEVEKIVEKEVDSPQCENLKKKEILHQQIHEIDNQLLVNSMDVRIIAGDIITRHYYYVEHLEELEGANQRILEYNLKDDRLLEDKITLLTELENL